jgi:hypothetical protein
MRKHFWGTLITLGGLLALAVPGVANAQLTSPGVVKANIPFSFIVGKTTFSAGDYRVENSGTERVLLITAEHSSQGGLINTLDVEAKKGSNQSKLIFHRYGNQYFLSQIWIKNETSGREIRSSRTEKELMAKAASHAVTILAGEVSSR